VESAETLIGAWVAILIHAQLQKIELVAEKDQHPEDPQNHAREPASGHRLAQNPHPEEHAPDGKRIREDRGTPRFHERNAVDRENIPGRHVEKRDRDQPRPGT